MRRHFRFGFSAESADDGSVLVAHVESHEVWYCGVCLERNEDRVTCARCCNRRGDWLCEECAHRNPKHADDCEGCGRPKPEDIE